MIKSIEEGKEGKEERKKDVAKTTFQFGIVKILDNLVTYLIFTISICKFCATIGFFFFFFE